MYLINLQHTEDHISCIKTKGINSKIRKSGLWFLCSTLPLIKVYLRVTPPILVRSIQGVLRRYAVRKGSVRSTQKSCYIVRRHLFLLLKGPLFIKKHTKRDIQSQIILTLRSRFLGVISAFINLNNDFCEVI